MKIIRGIYNLIEKGYFKINRNEFARGLVYGAVSAFALPFLAATQTPGFSLATANWHAVSVLALNSAIATTGSYLLVKLFSNKKGQIVGAIG